MPETKVKKEISFIIDGVELIKKRFELPDSPITKELDFSFEIGLDIKFNEQEKKSMHVVHTVIKSKEDNLFLGHISAACFFHILNFEEISITTNGSKTIPREHIDILNSISIGTLRGIMYSEFRGTLLSNAILPIIDIKAFDVEGL